MDVRPALTVVLAFVAGGAIVWLMMTYRQEQRAKDERIARLEQQLAEIGEKRQKWVEVAHLNHQSELYSVGLLMKTSLRDLIDAAYRVSPGLVNEVLRDLRLLK